MQPATELNMPFKVSIVAANDTESVLVFTFVPNSDAIGSRRQLVAHVEIETERIDWQVAGDEQGGLESELENEIRKRLQLRRDWIVRIDDLIATIETWANNAGWSTKRIPFRLDDRVIGKHRLTALMMQRELCKLLVEPIARSGPNANGMVDLYLMPAYDDIASLYFYGDRWHIHYMFHHSPTVATIREAEAIDFTSENLNRVLSEMHVHGE